MVLKTGMEVAQYFTVFNYGHTSPQKYLKSQGRTKVPQAGMNPAPIFFSQGTTKRNWEGTPTRCVDNG